METLVLGGPARTSGVGVITRSPVRHGGLTDAEESRAQGGVLGKASLAVSSGRLQTARERV